MRQLPGITAVTFAMLGPVCGGAAETSAVKPPAVKETSKAAPAADFLEYLATLEGAEDNWTDFAVAAAPPRVDGTKAVAPRAAKADEPR